MDKLQALYKSRNHWAYLYITGSKSKRKYLPSAGWYQNCAACEQVYDKVAERLNCKECLLTGYAWKDPNGYTLLGFCGLGSSFYAEWCKSNTRKQRRYWAYRMVQACNAAIETFLNLGTYRGGRYGGKRISAL